MVRNLLRNLHSGPLALQLRRFVAVGTVAAGVQQVLLWIFVTFGELNYLVGAAIAIEITIIFQYVLNNAWTFEATQNTGRREFFAGLLKTNVVRGSAIPIQLGILYALVEWGSLLYLVANGIAIVISGVYRYVLDARWTWGQA
ncbi:GtrA family protein [Halomicrobium katesii]|uniref:GtrA family protein n=1 Tax=Halomicrobium katesii TaxID=437163 RepID=UPI000377D83E|nr:GtrA family protein [Halomicrobium katesii]